MSLLRGGPPARQVPTLTEVVEPLLPAPAAAVSAPVPLAPAPAALPAAPAPAIDEQALVERVLVELQRQIDPVIEQKLRETLAPTLALVAEMLVHDSRDQLTGVLRDMAQRALAEALARQRRG
jgi:hypothetical protein